MKFCTFFLLGLVGLITLTATSDAEAYWHGYRGGWRGPGWGGPGCWRCGPGWAAGAVVAGATVVESAPPQVVVEQAPPVYASQPQQIVVAPGPVPVNSYSIPPIGSTFPNLFPGCVLEPRNGINFYQCQGFRMRPLYNGSNFFYRVVPG